MQWCVVKTGAELFDLLHAYGLGILLTYGCNRPIEVRDTGCAYTLTGEVETPPTGPLTLLDDALRLPTPQEVEATTKSSLTLPVANLDGLLTVLFTKPGVRALSVIDVQRKQRLNTATAEHALRKVSTTLATFKAVFSKRTDQDAEHWLSRVLQDYSSTAPVFPLPAEATRPRDLSVVMMIDPSLSYSTRRPRSDGLTSHKTQVTIRGTDFAILLALIGAARFLRAQRVNGNLVNCYVPQADSVSLDRDWHLPLLAPVDANASQAALLQCLSYVNSPDLGHPRWTGLAYQTIQTQGMQQSIPRGHGCLDLTWLTTRTFEHLVSFWRMQLALEPSRRACEIDTLVDALWTREDRHWIAHLLEVARCVHTQPESIRSYRLEEVKEVITHMHASIPSLLKKALEQKTGTLRFGHALRLLGDFNAAALRELVEDLDTVSTLDHLLHVLALTAQECQVAAAKTKFMVVPDDSDLGSLLMDVEQSSPATIAHFLVLLSALRYPRLDESELDSGRLIRVIFLLITALTPRPEARLEAQERPLSQEQPTDQEMTTQESVERKAEIR